MKKQRAAKVWLSALALTFIALGAWLFSWLFFKPAPKVEASAAAQPMSGATTAPPALMLAQPLPDPKPAPVPRGNLSADKKYVSLASSAWVYVPPNLTGVSAASLYAQLAHKRVDLIDAPVVAQLAEAVAKCRHQANLQRLVRGAEARGDANDAESLRQQSADFDDLCNGLPKAAFARSDEFLAQLAAMGDERAMALCSDGFVTRAPDPEREPQAWDQYKQTTLRYLHVMAERGYLPAIARLAYVYGASDFEIDPIKRLAYEYVLARALGNSNDERKISDELKNNPSQQVQVQQLASNIFTQCCAR